MIILKPLDVAAPPTAGGAAGAGSGAANLLTPDPKEVWVAGAVGVSTIDIDLGAAMDVDTFFLGFTNATAGATWLIQKGTGLGTGLTDLVPAGTAMRAADSLGPRHHGLAHLAAVANARYFRITVTQTGAEPLQAGALMLGKAFVAPYELGGGRQAIDTGAREDLLGGGFGIGEGVVKAALRWTFIDLAPADRRALWELVRDRGETKPVLVVEELGEGDEGLNEEMHYGVLDQLEAYERQAPGQTRWALRMTEWV
jgi:hypothetical protein